MKIISKYLLALLFCLGNFFSFSQKSNSDYVTVWPKTKDPINYDYEKNKAKIILIDTFNESISVWFEKEDSVEYSKMIDSFRITNNQFILYATDSFKENNLTFGRSTGFDFSENFEYEISFDILKNAALKDKWKMSFCLGMDSVSHNSGISFYIDGNNSFYINTPIDSLQKARRGTELIVSKIDKKRSNKIAIRHIAGNYSIFLNDVYIGKLKKAPLITGDNIHFGSHLANTTIAVNYIRIIKLP